MMNTMWRCFKCETFNNGQSCFICGTHRNTPPPRIPVTVVNRGPVIPEHSTERGGQYIPGPSGSESKAWIPAVIILGIIITILIVIIFSSL